MKVRMVKILPAGMDAGQMKTTSDEIEIGRMKTTYRQCLLK